MERQAMISFRADEKIHAILSSYPDRSEFIREAIVVLSGAICPHCHGSGVLHSCAIPDAKPDETLECK